MFNLKMALTRFANSFYKQRRFYYEEIFIDSTNVSINIGKGSGNAKLPTKHI